MGIPIVLALGILFLLILPAWASLPPPVTDGSVTPESKFAQGVRAYHTGEFEGAIRTFMTLIQENPGTPLLMEVQWMLAKAYEAKGDFGAAVEEYGSFLDNFPSSPYREEARLRLETTLKTLADFVPVHEPAQKGDVKGSRTPSLEPTGDRLLSGDPGILGGQFLLFPSRTYKELDGLFKQLAETGMNTVIVRVFQNQGDRKYLFVSGGGDVGVYFKTSHAPVVEDILTPLIESAHRNHLRVFAWLTTRTMDWIPSDVPWFDHAYDAVTRGTIKTRRLDLFNPEVQDYLQSLYRDLAAYPIDGVLLQDDLVYRHREGFSPYASTRFQKAFGVPLTPESLYRETGAGKPYRPLFWRWVGWRSREILGVADAVIRTSREIHPGLPFVLNLNYETVLDPVNALAWFSQDLMEAQKVPFDYYAVMAYHRQMEKETRNGFEETVELVRRIGETLAGAVSDPSRVLIKIQAVDWETGLPLPPGELKILSEKVAMENGVGIAYVFNGYSPPMDLLQGVFSLFGGGAKRGTGYAPTRCNEKRNGCPGAGCGGIGGCPEGTPHGPPHPIGYGPRDLTSR